MVRRPISQASLNRLWLWAIVSQPAYWLALKGQSVTFWDLNILFAFAVAGQCVKGAQSRFVFPVVVTVVLLLGYLPLSSMSYGVAGIVMLLASVGLFHAQQQERQKGMLALWMVSVLALNFAVGLIYALAGLLLSLMVWFAITQRKTVRVARFLLNRPGFLGEFLVRELRLPDLYPSGKHNTFALLQLELHSRCVLAIGGY
ncbi:MAG: TraX family protein [Citrobacter sp.]|uniref:TraX family protein n=1 Tax=Citrobacter sp. TaxID=1896336 RepID=UPI002FC8951B